MKTYVNPELPGDSSRKRAVRVVASVKIDELGNTSVRGLQGASPVEYRAVVSAVQKWKFYPAIVDSRPRCVEADLPIMLSR